MYIVPTQIVCVFFFFFTRIVHAIVLHAVIEKIIKIRRHIYVKNNDIMMLWYLCLSPNVQISN